MLDELRNAAGEHGLTFGPDPATHSRNTLGGMIGNNSCGIHSMMAGETVDNIEELDIVLYDGTRMTVGATSDEELERIIAEGGREGEIYRRLETLRDRYADRIRAGVPDDSAPGLRFQSAGAAAGAGLQRREGAGRDRMHVRAGHSKPRAKLVYNPPVRSLLVFGYQRTFSPPPITWSKPAKFGPIGLEALDDTFIDYMKKKGLHPPDMNFMPEGNAWLLIEFGGKDKAEADANARKCMDDFSKRGDAPPMKLFDDPAQEKLVWHLREEGLGATAKVPDMPENHEGWEDASVPPEQARRLPARVQAADRQVRLRRSAVWPLRPGMRPHAADVRSADGGGNPEVARLSRQKRPTSWSATAARCRVNTATGRRAASCSPGCSARRSSMRSASSRRSGIPTGR